jgi:ribosomal-protein-alanine N-acetyltransferase
VLPAIGMSLAIRRGRLGGAAPASQPFRAAAVFHRLRHLMRAPETLMTARLMLRRPVLGDAASILESYAGDAEVTRLLAWPRHRSLEDTQSFVRWSDEVWSGAVAGPYVILDRGGQLVGSTGLDVETLWRATTGFVLARAAWGRGYATEVAAAMAQLAGAIGLARLYALCHVENRASAHVLAKAGFAREGVLRRHVLFPNLDSDLPSDVECWGHVT